MSECKHAASCVECVSVRAAERVRAGIYAELTVAREALAKAEARAETWQHTAKDYDRSYCIARDALLREREWLKAAEQRATAAEARAERLEKALAFAASCIKSDEDWTETCQKVIGGALSTTEVDGET